MTAAIPPDSRPIPIGTVPGIIPSGTESSIGIADDPSAFDMPKHEKSMDLQVVEEMIKTFSALSLSGGLFLGLFLSVICPPLGIAFTGALVAASGASSVPYGIISGLDSDKQNWKEILQDIGKATAKDFGMRFLPNLCHQTLVGNVALALGNSVIGLFALTQHEREKTRKFDEWIKNGRQGKCPIDDQKLDYDFGAIGKNMGGISGFRPG